MQSAGSAQLNTGQRNAGLGDFGQRRSLRDRLGSVFRRGDGGAGPDGNTVRKVILCAVVFAFCLIPAIFLNTIYGYLPVLMAAILIGGSYGYMRLLRRYLQYEEKSNMANCVRGTKIDFAVQLHNRSVLFYPLVEPSFYIADLFGADDSVLTDIITLAPREDRTFDFDARFDHIGTYSAGLRRIRLTDLLGLFSHTIENDKRYQVNVIPQVYAIERVPVSRTAVSESQKMTVSNPMDASDYAGVREYVIGDPIKSIHWKLSARTTGYMTKMFESYSNTGICVIMDFHAPAYRSDALMSVFDCVVETALSVGSYAVREGLDSELRYLDKYGERRQLHAYERDDFVEMMGDMPRIHTQPDAYGAVDLLWEQGNSLYSQGNIAICTADLSQRLVEALMGIRGRRKNPMLFAVVPEGLTDAQKARVLAPLGTLEDAGIFYHVLSDAASLEGGDLS